MRQVASLPPGNSFSFVPCIVLCKSLMFLYPKVCNNCLFYSSAGPLPALTVSAPLNRRDDCGGTPVVATLAVACLPSPSRVGRPVHLGAGRLGHAFPGTGRPVAPSPSRVGRPVHLGAGRPGHALPGTGRPGAVLQTSAIQVTSLPASATVACLQSPPSVGRPVHFGAGRLGLALPGTGRPGAALRMPGIPATSLPAPASPGAVSLVFAGPGVVRFGRAPPGHNLPTPPLLATHLPARVPAEPLLAVAPLVVN